MFSCLDLGFGKRRIAPTGVLHMTRVKGSDGWGELAVKNTYDMTRHDKTNKT